MRTEFVKTLEELAQNDDRIFLLTGDLGFSVFERFQEKNPDRFFNMGIAEANMVGVAAGLALSGKIVYIYSIVPFVTMRCFEQVRNDLCLQNLDVKIIGAGGGLSYGYLGPTHHSIEDIAIMRSLPNMTVVCPGDPAEAGMATRMAAAHDGPVYIRLGRGGEPVIHDSVNNFEIGRGILVKDGDNIAIISTGNMLESAVLAAEKLKEKNISARVISMHTVKPLDRDLVLKTAKETKAIFTLEEHSLIGGLGGAVSEVLSECGEKILFRRLALPDSFIKISGSQKYLRQINLLSTDLIVDRILKELERR